MISVTIDGNLVNLQRNPKRDKTLDGRTTLTFTVNDPTATIHYYPGQPVTATDTVLGVLFTGFVATIDERHLQPQPDNLLQIAAIDLHYLADKRSYSGVDFTNRYAGDIATELISAVLANEGVAASYAIDRDVTQANFSEGVSNGLLATANNGGDLELAPSGSTYSSHYTIFGITSMQALKFVGTAVSGYTNNYTYRMVYSVGGSITIASGDYLQYDVWVQSNSPQIMCGLDFVCTDGSTFRDSTDAAVDSQSIGPHPKNDLSGLANDQWYSRTLSVGASLVGKRIQYFTIAFEGDNPGTYTAYIRRAYYGNGSTHKADIVTDTTTSPQANQQISINGYQNVVLSIVAAHDKQYQLFYNDDLSSVGYAKNSIMYWDPAQISKYIASDAQLLIQTSVDNGASRQVAVNGSPIAGILPGANMSGRKLFCWKTVTQGMDPTASTTVPDSWAQIQSAPANNGISGATDVFTDYDLNSQWDTGTYSNLRSGGQSNLQMAGQWAAFSSNADWIGRTTSFGGLGVYIKQQTLFLNSTSEGRLRLDFAGSWQNFTAEIDVFVGTGYSVGMVYRTTGWQSNNDTYGYAVNVGLTSLTLVRGSNSGTGTGTPTTISTAGVALSDQTWHHLTIQVNGSSHVVLLDGVQYISATDTTYSATGQLGLRLLNSGSSLLTTQAKNFGVINGLSGTWTSPAINLAPAITAGSNLIIWDNSQNNSNGLSWIPQGASITIQTSLDGGTTWLTATNGAAIPGLTAGQNLSGISLKIRATLATTSAAAQPTLGGLSICLCPQYLSTGYRITVPLNISSVLRAGSTLISWTGAQPANTSIYVDSSLDDFTFTQIGSGAIGSGQIAGIYIPPDPYLDDFTDYSPVLYNQTSVNVSSGIRGSWTYDSANNRILAVSPGTGSGCLMLYKGLNALDVEISSVLDSANTSGLLLRYNDVNNFYYCVISDSSAPDSNMLRVYKVAAGTTYPLGSASITFAHGTPHVLKFSCINNILSASLDGVLLVNFDDSMHTPLGAGLTGFYNDGGAATYYYLRAQAWGANVSAPTTQVFTRVRMSSTDPTATPYISDLSTSVHNSNIQNGALIPSTSYSVLNGSKNTLAADLDDLAKQSDFYWIIREDGQFLFQSRPATMAPWSVTSKDIIGPPKVSNVDDNYRNSEWIINGIDVVPQQESFGGDGQTTSWALGYPVASIQSITVNGVPVTFGVKSASSGKNFYYDVGSASITQDSSGTPLTSAQTLVVIYQGQVPITVCVQRDDEISTRAGIDNTTGIIEVVEDAGGLNKAATITLADSKLSQFCTEARSIQFDTLRDGLAPGQFIVTFVPEHGIIGDMFLITDVATTWETVGNNQLQAFYTVQATSGAIVGDWSRWFVNLSKF